MNTFSLNRWDARDIFNYWKLLAGYCGKKNPFTIEAADTVYEVSEGKPRTVAQLTRLSLTLKAMQNSGLEITSEDVLSALRRHVRE